MGSNGLNAGGWTIDPIVVDGQLPEKIATGWTQAFTGWVGTGYKPLIYCGVQVVNGTNHMFICEGTTVTNPPLKNISKVILHETLPEEGKLSGDFSVLLIDTIA